MSDMAVVMFSKDRPLQADGAIRSLKRDVADIAGADIDVLYAASTPAIAALYAALAEEHPEVQFRREADFKVDVIDLASRRGYLLFLVDDALFVGPTSIGRAMRVLSADESCLGFSFRLGRNTTYCYPVDAPQALPAFDVIEEGLLAYDWTQAEQDFAYPLELSSSLYRSLDVLPPMQMHQFTDPNTLEAALAAEAPSFRSTRPRLVCHETSVAVSIPANVVQTTFRNRVAPSPELAATALALAFASGKRLDVERYQGMVSNACHQEMTLRLDEPARRPTVSVVIPCYQQAEFLNDAIESVVAQTFTDWELVVVDDGSPDETADVTERLIAAYPSRDIRLLRRPNGGVSAARNAGVAFSTGKYVLPLDADDTIALEMLAATVAALNSNPSVAIAYTDYETFGMQAARVQAPEFEARLVPTINQFPYCALFRRDAWLKVGGYNPNMSAGYEDWDFWIGFVEAGFKALRVPLMGFRYRVSSTSRTSNALEHDAELRHRTRRNHPSAYRLRRRLERGFHRLGRSLRLRLAGRAAG